MGVEVVADGQLASRDHALGLEADVQQHLVPVDLDDRSLHDVAVVELDDGAVDGLLEGHAPEVVLGDLCGDVGPHGIEGPETWRLVRTCELLQL